METIRIFISSPGDVAQERQRAREVIESLRRRYSRSFFLKPVFWEDLPLQPDMSFQEGIDMVLSAEGPDIAVFILWSRLGSPVGAAIPKPDGTEYRSGTEREYDLMVSARRSSVEAEGKARPAMLIYTRRDDASFEEALRGTTTDQKKQLIRQKEMVESFLTETFRDQETGVNIGAYFPFDRPVTFSQRLRVHLQELLDQRSGESDQVVWDIDTQGAPFLGLEAFQPEHAAVFFGREAEVLEARHALKEQARNGCAFLLLFGPSGSGKSSLARAGLLPAIVEHEIDDQITAWKTLVLTPGEIAPDPIAGLVARLADGALLPALGQDAAALEEVAAGLKKDPELTFRLRVKDAIASASKKQNGNLRLLLIIDQIEEIFTTPAIAPADRTAFFAMLEAFTLSGVIWVVATARSDFYQHLQAEPALVRMKAGAGQLDVLPPGAESLARLIEEPARLAGLSFEKRDDHSLASVILKEAVSHPELLPLVEFVLRELFEQRSDHRQLTFAAYESLGGVEGALAKRAEETFAALPDDARQSLPHVLESLVTVGSESTGPGGDAETVVRQRALLSAFENNAGRVLIDSFVAARLFTTDQSESSGEAAVSVAHESLLRIWPRAVTWKESNLDFLRVRARVATRMKEGSPLLAGDPLLDAAKNLVAARPDGFSEDQRNWIAAAVSAAEAREKLIVRRRRLAFAALTVLTLLALAAAGFAVHNGRLAKQQAELTRKQAAEAIAQREHAKESRKQAESILNYLLYDLQDKLRPVGRMDIIADVQDRIDKYYDEFGIEEGNFAQLRDRGSAAASRGDVQYGLNKLPEALIAYKEALSISRKLAKINPADDVWQLDLHLALAKVGNILGVQGLYAEAQPLVVESLDVSRKLLAKEPDNTLYLTDHKIALNQLGDLWYARGRDEEATPSFEEALACSRKLAAKASDEVAGLDQLALAIVRLADNWSRRGGSEAGVLYDEAITTRHTMLTREPNNSQWERALATLLEKVGRHHGNAGHFERAVAAGKEAVELGNGLVAKYPVNPTRRADLCISLGVLGDIYRMKGASNEAAKAYGEAVSIGRKIVVDEPKALDWQRELGVSMSKLGGVLMDQQRYGEAETTFREMVGIIDKLVGAYPDSAKFLRDHLQALGKLGGLLSNLGRYEEATAMFEQALVSARKFAVKSSNELEGLDQLALTITALADTWSRRNGSQADALYDEAISVRRTLIAKNSGDSQWEQSFVELLEKAGSHHSAAGHFDQAVAAGMEAAVTGRALMEKYPDDVGWAADLGLSLGTLGDIRSKQRAFDEAVKAYGEAVGIERKLVAKEPKTLQWQRELGVSLVKLGTAFINQQHPADADACFRELVEMIRKPVAPAWDDALFLDEFEVALDDWGDRLTDSGRDVEAIAAFEQALLCARKIAMKSPDQANGSNRAAQAIVRLAEVWSRRHDSQADGLYDEAISIYRELIVKVPANPYWQQILRTLLIKVAEHHAEMGKFDRAVPLGAEAIVISRKLVADDTSNPGNRDDLAFSLTKQGDVLRMQRKFPEATKACTEAVDMAREIVVENPKSLRWQSSLGLSLTNLGKVFADDQHFAKAEDLFREALEIGRKLTKAAPNNFDWQVNLARVLMKLGENSHHLGRDGEAPAFNKEALAILQKVESRDRLSEREEGWKKELEAQIGQSEK